MRAVEKVGQCIDILTNLAGSMLVKPRSRSWHDNPLCLRRSTCGSTEVKPVQYNVDLVSRCCCCCCYLRLSNRCRAHIAVSLWCTLHHARTHRSRLDRRHQLTGYSNRSDLRSTTLIKKYMRAWCVVGFTYLHNGQTVANCTFEIDFMALTMLFNRRQQINRERFVLLWPWPLDLDSNWRRY